MLKLPISLITQIKVLTTVIAASTLAINTPASAITLKVTMTNLAPPSRPRNSAGLVWFP